MKYDSEFFERLNDEFIFLHIYHKDSKNKKILQRKAELEKILKTPEKY
jgi:hypothetical protein